VEVKSPVVIVPLQGMGLLFVLHPAGYKGEVVRSSMETVIISQIKSINNQILQRGLGAGTKPMWERLGVRYSSVLLMPGDLLAMGCAYSQQHQVLIPEQGEARKVLILGPATPAPCMAVEASSNRKGEVLATALNDYNKLRQL
jgi:hypothetical protein